MISKHLGIAARRMRQLAREEQSAGHLVTAMDLYFAAAELFGNAQHVIFANNDEKSYLHRASVECYDRVRELAPYRIERIEIEWEGVTVVGNLHIAPTAEPAPCIFFVPGCDMTKEMYPHPRMNQALQRGMHLFSFDGPGQGESNLRGIKLTLSNYEEAASAAIDYLLTRPEIDPHSLGVYGLSFGSYWALRIAAKDSRLCAVAAPWASCCDLRYLMSVESPRYKQLFTYMTGAPSEAEFDKLVLSMDLRRIVQRIACPILLTVGEFDPRSPIDEVLTFFDDLRCPAELWVFADQHHKVSLTAPNSEALTWLEDVHALSCDWLLDRFRGKALVNEGQIIYVAPEGGGPYGSGSARKRKWYEES